MLLLDWAGALRRGVQGQRGCARHAARRGRVASNDLEGLALTLLRIGTWNLGRSGAFHRSRVPRQLQVLQQQHADLWVLTDAHDANVPPEGQAMASLPHADFHHRGEHRVILWSRHPLSPVETDDPVSSVAALVAVPGLAQPLLVCGAVITHAHGGLVQRPTLSWQRHQEAVSRQRLQWLRMRREYPEHALCVAGDFNVDLDPSARYAAPDARHGLLQGLDEAGMKCLSTRDLRGSLAPGLGSAAVDHVCFSDLPGLRSRLEAWPGTRDGQALSDRGGILAQLEWAPARVGETAAQRPAALDRQDPQPGSAAWFARRQPA